MARISGPERRGAVHFWRRRVPQTLARSIGRTHLRICLGTKDLKESGFLGAGLDATAAEAFMMVPARIFDDQLKQVFVTAFEQLREELQMFADCKRGGGQYNAGTNAR